MSDVIAQPLTETFHAWVTSTIDDEGISLPHGFAIDADGALTMYALAVPPADAYALMLAEWVSKKPAEMIFAFDRFALPGQGTTLGDLMAGFHFAGDAPRPFVIEYQHDPRIVLPFNWSNEWWNSALLKELGNACRLSGVGAGAVELR